MKDLRETRWKRLVSLLDQADRSGSGSLTAAELKELCRLYRQVSIDLSRARAERESADILASLNMLASRAHGRVYGAKRETSSPRSSSCRTVSPGSCDAIGGRSSFPRPYSSRPLWPRSSPSSANPPSRIRCSTKAPLNLKTSASRSRRESTKVISNISTNNRAGAAAQIIVNNVRVALIELGLGAFSVCRVVS